MSKKRKTIDPVETVGNRRSREYLQWAKAVKVMAGYECDCCHFFSPTGKGLVSHHLNSFTENEEQQFELENGCCLCVDCHNKFHKVYKKKCTAEEYYQWKDSIIHKG